MGATGLEPVSEGMKPFLSGRIRKPLPGALGEDAGLYIAMGELESLKPTSLYEYHRELERLRDDVPGKGRRQLCRWGSTGVLGPEDDDARP